MRGSFGPGIVRQGVRELSGRRPIPITLQGNSIVEHCGVNLPFSYNGPTDPLPMRGHLSGNRQPMPRSPHPTRPVASLADFDPVADALVDKLTLTCHLTFAQLPAGGAAGLRARLARANIVAARGGKWAKVTFRWTCPHSRVRLWLDGSLAIADGANGVVLAVGASKLDLNLLSLLRKQVEPRARGEPRQAAELRRAARVGQAQPPRPATRYRLRPARRLPAGMRIGVAFARDRNFGCAPRN